MKRKTYYTVYKITNKRNQKIYIGVHKTKNLYDKYFGSGSNITKAILNEGVENFKKEILFKFDNKESMLEKEAELVDKDFIKRKDTYNIILGGQTFYSGGLVPVKDKNGNSFLIRRDDPMYLSGIVKHVTTGRFTAIDKEGNKISIYRDDPRYLSGELVAESKGKVMVKDKNGKKFKVPKDDLRYLSGELKHIYHNTIIVKDKKGKKFHVEKDDPRYLNGELVGVTKGFKHSEETKRKMSISTVLQRKNQANARIV